MATGRVPAAGGSPLTAKGDLYTYSTTQDRLAVGSNGDTLVADSSATTGLRWQGNFAAGKNKIINGDFNIWQRGTSFTPAGVAGVSQYNADRFFSNRDGTGATVTTSRQTFTPGTAPVAGYEAQYFYRYAQTVAGTGATYTTVLGQIIEGLGLSGQTVTFSFWAKADTARTVAVGLGQYFGAGGSSSVYSSTTNVNLTTSWARYSVTFAIPSIAGKTIGTGQVGIEFYISGTSNATQTYDFWGVQAEIGSVATAFQTATGTLTGELAACQRYYFRVNGANDNQGIGAGVSTSTTNVRFTLPLPTPMRTEPTVSIGGSITAQPYNGGANVNMTAFTGTYGGSGNGVPSVLLDGTVGTTTANIGFLVYTAVGAANFMEASAEL